jgi:hypothetical protein
LEYLHAAIDRLIDASDDSDIALSAADDALGLAKALVGTNPTQERRFHYAISLSKYAYLIKSSDKQRAIAMFTEGLQIQEDILRDDDSLEYVRRDAALARLNIGQLYSELTEFPIARTAHQQRPSGPGKGSDPAARAPSQAIADFVTGFDLKSAPPIVIERARIAFVDTVGVMLAGSQLPPADIVCDIIKLEGSAPVATIVGRPLRTSPQLAALANGVAGHAMDFDLNTAGQSVAGVIPAILPVAETTGPYRMPY